MSTTNTHSTQTKPIALSVRLADVFKRSKDGDLMHMNKVLLDKVNNGTAFVDLNQTALLVHDGHRYIVRPVISNMKAEGNKMIGSISFEIVTELKNKE